MKYLFLTLLIPFSSLLGQEAQPEAPAEKKELQYQIDIDNLTAEQRQQLFVETQNAKRLFDQKRIFECLDTIEKAHKIYAKSPATLNFQGACYVEIRNFEKARACFKKALESHPGNPNVMFNLAEIDFVTHNWKAAHDQLSTLIDENSDGENNEGMLDLLRFKVLLCKIKLDNVEEAKAIVDQTNFLDDTPLHYYGHAALAYAKDDRAAAEVWLTRASRIFKAPRVVAPWQDTLIEFGYIKSFYGGDLDVSDDPVE